MQPTTSPLQGSRADVPPSYRTVVTRCHLVLHMQIPRESQDPSSRCYIVGTQREFPRSLANADQSLTGSRIVAASLPQEELDGFDSPTTFVRGPSP